MTPEFKISNPVIAKSEKNIFLGQLGKHLAEIRRENNISQEQLSFDADMDLSTISKIERGVLNISVFNLQKIAKALKVKTKDLLDF